MPPFLRVAILLLAAPVVPAQTPDTIYIHGNILTGTHLRADDVSATPARVTALAIANGKILAAGSDADILKRKSPTTKVIDIHNAFVMPGINDAHTHIANAGRQKLSANLIGCHSLAEMKLRIRTYATRIKPGDWIVGGGWDHTLWPGSTLPTREDLDHVTAGHPAIFRRVDEHMAVANTAALVAAGITAQTPDPQGAKIDRDSQGNPTGILRETAAYTLVYNKVPPSTPEQRRQALLVAIDDALANGVTTVQDNSDWDDFLALQQLERDHKLRVRVSEWLEFAQPVDVLVQRQASQPTNDPLLHLAQLKGFMDGSLGSRTAVMAAPYSDDPKNSGLPRYNQQKLNQMAADRAAKGFQLGLHAIGDRANTMALDAFAYANKTTPVAPLRFRIEHAQILLPGDFNRFAQLRVIASMQPSHLLTDMNWAEARIGPERAKYAYAWKSLLNHHVVLAFGTDYPVEPINPFRGLYSAITRKNEAGTKTFELQEKLTLNEALYAYTQASAYAEFREHEKGRLEPGFNADLIVLDRDITKTTAQQLLHAKVLRTVLNGETVYTAPASVPTK